MKMTGEAVGRRVKVLFAACAIACLASQTQARDLTGSTNLPAQTFGLGQASGNRLSLQGGNLESTNAVSRSGNLNILHTAAATMPGQTTSAQSLTSSPPSGLIVWWMFNEGSGPTVEDASGNGHSGTLLGDSPPAWANGVTSGALDFDGYQNYVESDNAFNETISAYTIEAWFAATSVSGENPAIISTLGDDIGFDYLGDILIYTNSSFHGNAIGLNTRWDVLTAPLGLVDGKWHHVVGTWDGSVSSLYVDGQLVATQADVHAAFAWTTPLRLAYRDTNGGCNYGGEIGEVRIYNRALSSDEVATNYNADTIGDGIPDWWRLKYFGSGTTTDSVSCADCDPNLNGIPNSQEYTNNANPLLPSGLTVPPDLIVWWRFDEGTGMFVGDVSGNGHSGVLVGDPVWTNGVTSGALTFDGSQNYVQSELPFHETINAYTIEAWFSATSASGENPVIISTLGDDIGFDYLGDILIWTNGLFYGNAIGLNTRWDVLVANEGLLDGQWHHVAGVWDGTNSSLYVDGQLVATQADEEDGFLWTTPLRLAYRATNGGCNYGGNIGEVRIYRRGLSGNEVAADYNTDTVGDGIPDWWRLKYFGSGTTTNNLSCADCNPSGDGFTNLQKFHYGMNPLVAYSLTVPSQVNSHSDGNPASVTELGSGVSYSWSIDNGTVTSGDGTPAIMWTAGDTGITTLNVSVQLSGHGSLSISGSALVDPCSLEAVILTPPEVRVGSTNIASVPIALTTLYSFTNAMDGANPQGVIEGTGIRSNLFYGTAAAGGTNDSGTLFTITSNGVFTTLWQFNDAVDGSNPSALIQGGNGVFYGTTPWGGPKSNGTVFAFTPPNTLTTLYSFTNCSLANGVILGRDGNLYGTAGAGGSNGLGVVFKIGTNGSGFQVLHNFGGRPEGGGPMAGLVQGIGSDTNFYGTTIDGGMSYACGSYGCGTVFRISATGTFSNFHSFSHSDGGWPIGGLATNANGNLYGTTFTGGDHGAGTIFQISPQGALTTVYNLSNGTNGGGLDATLVLGFDGNYYGTTYDGGVTNGYGYGTVFRVSPQGSFTTLYDFTGGNDGAFPLYESVSFGLSQSSYDGYLYGVTTFGGSSGVGFDGYGTVFKLNPATYSWSIVNGTIIGPTNTPSIQWTTSTTNLVTICVTASNSSICTATACTTVIPYTGAIAAGGSYSLALTPDGKLWSWGENDDGQLGDGVSPSSAEFSRPYPGEVADVTSCTGQAISAPSALASGDDFMAAIDAIGTVWTCGGNDFGKLGWGPPGTDSFPPSSVPGIGNVISVAAGGNYMLALRADGVVFAWGDNDRGQLGIGSSGGSSTSPTQPLALARIVAIAAGDIHSVALDANGNVWTWGAGGSGQLGNGGNTDVTTAAQVAGISNVIAIAAGLDHTIALTADKTVWTWGDNSSSHLGRSGDNRVPGVVPSLSNVVAIAGGNEFTLAATTNGQVYAWGDNSDGQLGTNKDAVSSTSSPMLVGGVSNAVLVSARATGYHSMAMTVDHGTNRYLAWGNNYWGQIGNGTNNYNSGGGTNDYRYTPAQVQFCTRCQRCVQLGTSGILTAQCNGTLYLYFNGEQGQFVNYSGSYTATVSNLATNIDVPAFVPDSTYYGVSDGIAVGTVTNGGIYHYTATGYCAYATVNIKTDPNGVDITTRTNVDCSNFGVINITNAVCPARQCFSLIGKIQ